MQQPGDQHEKVHLAQLKKGSQVSFEWLYHRYQPRLYAFCHNLTRSKPDAEEVVQQVFVKVWETRHRIDPEQPFSAYLIQIGKHAIYNKSAQSVRDFAFQKYYSTSTDTQSNITQEEINLRSLEDSLETQVQKLPFMQKRVFLLSRSNGLNSQEIAERLQISRSTVENHIYAALKTLKRYLLKHHYYLLLVSIYWCIQDFIS